MSRIIITKDRMREILASLMEERRVAAPVKDGKVVDYIEVGPDGVQDILMGDEIAYKSPKEFFFPRCEKIITFKDDEAIAEMPGKGLVLFGARPCDLEALKIMTAVFTTGKFEDPFFKANLDASLIIGVACREKKPACFCDARETDKAYSESCDLFLKNTDEGYEALYVSEKGREALGSYIPGLESLQGNDGADGAKSGRPLSGESALAGDSATPTAATAAPAAPANTPATSAGDSVKTLSLDKAELDMFDKIDWEKHTEICQGCGMCTYICPTCHCFVFKDVEESGTVCRYRNWDSCMFPKFTLHASGHNPRASIKERYRQRILHKYSYVKENFGYVACTGCGRCVRSCPAGMNIKTIVEDIVEELGR